MATRVLVAGLLLGLAASGCGVEHDVEAPIPQQKLDLGPRAPIDEPILVPDQGAPRCGDQICQPDENPVTCCRDCCPRNPAPIRPDPGWIDPIRGPAGRP